MGRKRKRLRQRKIIVPVRIRERWLENHHGTDFRLRTAISKANVDPEEFKKCWKHVQPTLSEDELFRLFDSTFGSVGNLGRKVKFVRHILALHQGTRTTVRVRINVPKRIRKRWRSTRTEFAIGKSLSEANIDPEEFKKCWRHVQPTLSEKKLFRLFDSTFGSVDNLERQVKFVKHILTLHQGTRTTARVRSSCDDGYTKDQVKEQFYRDLNLDSWFEKHAASDGTVSQNQIDMKLVKHALSTLTRILDDVDFLSKSKRDAVTERIEESSDTRDSDTDNGDVSTDDDENVVHVGDQFVYSDDEEGDSTFTVRRIARGGLVYVEEDDESLSLQYVRKKVRVFD